MTFEEGRSGGSNANLWVCGDCGNSHDSTVTECPHRGLEEAVAAALSVQTRYESGRVRLENTDQTLTNVHSPEMCFGEFCTIHNRSEHHMRSWPQAWREDIGMMERLCLHGVGHPDPDDYKVGLDESFSVHSCDGCCVSWGGGAETSSGLDTAGEDAGLLRKTRDHGSRGDASWNINAGDHDPLCNQAMGRWDGICECDLFAKVRADQDSKWLQVLQDRKSDFSSCSREDDCSVKAEGLQLAIDDAVNLLGLPAVEKVSSHSETQEFADVAFELGVDNPKIECFAYPLVVSGTYKGRFFYLRERWGTWTVTVASETDPARNVWVDGGGVNIVTGPDCDIYESDLVFTAPSVALHVAVSKLREHMVARELSGKEGLEEAVRVAGSVSIRDENGVPLSARKTKTAIIRALDSQIRDLGLPVQQPDQATSDEAALPSDQLYNHEGICYAAFYHPPTERG